MADWNKDFPQPVQPAASAPAGGLRVEFADPEKHQVTVTLDYPLAIEGERIEALTVRRLTAGEMIRIVEGPDAPREDAELTRHVVAAMIGWPVEVLNALFPDDAGRVAEAALPFMPAGLRAALERAEAVEAGTLEAGTTDDAA